MTKQACDSYITDNFSASIKNDSIYEVINQENKAFRGIESIKITRNQLLSDISMDKLYNWIITYEEEQSFLNNSENSKRKIFSNWQNFIFDRYKTNFYEIERKHTTLLIDRMDLLH